MCAEAGELGMAHVTFEPDDHSTPGEGLRLLPCPTKLPHDLEVGHKVALWFDHPFRHPFNAWHIGKIVEVNRRRTKSENVSVEFVSAEEGVTRGMFVADAACYGADRLWVLVQPIPIDLAGSSSGSPSHSDEES